MHRAIVVLAAAAALAGCAAVSGTPVPTGRRDAAVIPTGYRQSLEGIAELRMPPGQVLTHARVAGFERWCSQEIIFFPSAWTTDRPSRMCFADRAGRGRFNEAFQVTPLTTASGGYAFAVNVPYVIEPLR